MRRLLAAFAAALAAVAVPAALAPAAAQARRDWTQTVVATPEGGVRMGDPDAPLRVVEFVSLTCPHCRSFAANGAPRLVDDYVRSGRASFEIRPFPLDPIAEIAAQLTRCAAPASFFALNDAILAAQDEWIGRIEALTEPQFAELERLPRPQLRARVAALAGLDALAARHGLGAEEVRACLADEAAAARVEAIRAAAHAQGVDGTPSFLINGRLAPGVHDWTALEPLLRGR